MIRGQEAEDPVGGACFGGLGRGTGMGLTVLRMDRHVAHVDLDQIMQDQHPDHAVDIHAGAA